MSGLQNHPVQTLLFYVEEETSDEACLDIEATIAKAAKTRDWLLGPPAFVNEHDDTGILTLGGLLRIYSGMPPNELPLELDKTLYEEVSQVIHLTRELSIAHRLTFLFELDDDLIGCVSGGDMEEGLEQGLLGEWRRALESRE